jgi:23S rRNA (pseudouridine1915-N3)-methyltransferase
MQQACARRFTMRITICAVGKIKEKFYRDAIAEYSKRLGKYCRLEIVEVEDEKTPDNAGEALETAIKEKEERRILSHIKEDSYVIALTIDGCKLDSVKLSEKLEKLGIQGTSHITFIIGGSLGLSDEVQKRADYRLSFSDMTFPHQLMRVILLEQIYRSFRIMKNEPYHK